MNKLENTMKERAASLLTSGDVARVVGWVKGEFLYDPSPASFTTVESLENFVYNDFCGANLSKYLIEISKKEGKTPVFLDENEDTKSMSLWDMANDFLPSKIEFLNSTLLTIIFSSVVHMENEVYGIQKQELRLLNS